MQQHPQTLRRPYQVVAFMDSCFSGKKADSNELLFKNVAPALLKSKNANIDVKKMTVITAGNNTQFSNAYEDKGHRLFSYYVMKGLLENKNDVSNLYSYVKENVAKTSKKKGISYLQEPQFSGKKTGAI